MHIHFYMYVCAHVTTCECTHVYTHMITHHQSKHQARDSPLHDHKLCWKPTTQHEQQEHRDQTAILPAHAPAAPLRLATAHISTPVRVCACTVRERHYVLQRVAPPPPPAAQPLLTSTIDDLTCLFFRKKKRTRRGHNTETLNPAGFE